MKRIVSRLAVVGIIALIGLAYTWFTGKDSGADVAQTMLDDFNTGAAVSYDEKYVGDGYSGTFTFKRDSVGNMLIIDQGTETVDGVNQPYYSEAYKIGDIFWVLEGDAFVEYADDGGYFEEEVVYIAEFISYNGVDLFADDINADYKRKDGNYIATGIYADSTETYTVKVAKDGKSMSLLDDTHESLLSFEYDEEISVPQ